MTQVPIAQDLFTWPSDSPALIAGTSSDGHIEFPYRKQRLVAGVREDLEKVELPRRGKLWTFTSQVFRPTSPPYTGDDDAKSFVPFATGYIEFENGFKIESRLTGADVFEIGQEMELVIVPFNTDADGNEVMTYAFAPVTEGAAS